MKEEAVKPEIIIRAATLEHARRLAPVLRCSDRRELAASGNGDPEDVLTQGVMVSAECWAAVKCSCLVPCQKSPPCPVVAIWGVAPCIQRGSGMIWMLASDLLAEPEARRACARESREFVKKSLTLYKYVENWVFAENAVSVRWLEWLGFAMEEAAPAGPQGKLFRHFTMKRGEVRDV